MSELAMEPSLLSPIQYPNHYVTVPICAKGAHRDVIALPYGKHLKEQGHLSKRNIVTYNNIL